MTPGFVRFLRAVIVTVGLTSLALGGYTWHRFPRPRVNRASRVPVRRRTVAVARYGLSAAFLLTAVTAVGGLLTQAARMARLETLATGDTAVERVVLALPAEGIVAVGLALAVVLVVVPAALVALDVLTAVVGGRDHLDGT